MSALVWAVVRSLAGALPLVACRLPPYADSGAPPCDRLANLNVRSRPVDDAATIGTLVDELASVRASGIGYSGAIAARAFLPLGLEFTQAVMAIGNPIVRSEVLERIVRAGHVAIPVLLQHIDDKRPTQLQLEARLALCYEWRFDINPANPTERELFARLPLPVHATDRIYSVTVGDLCFVALGQITNRNYACAQYVPTGILSITSPSRDAVLAKRLRLLWGRASAADLWTHLWLDFTMLGHENQDAKTGAAVRLAYYYPDIGGSAVSGLVRSLSSSVDPIARDNANGLNTLTLLAALSRVESPDVQFALLDMVVSSLDDSIVRACLGEQAVGNESAVVGKARQVLSSLPLEGVTAADSITRLLRVVHRVEATEIAAVGAAIMRANSAQWNLGLCRYLQAVHVGAGVEHMLFSLLSDRRYAGSYRVVDAASENPEGCRTIPMRICDEAALAMAFQAGDTLPEGITEQQIECLVESKRRQMPPP